MKSRYKNISLKKMLEAMVEDICSDDAPQKFYWKDGHGDLHEIVECDLCRGRFVTDNQDFSEFSWELSDSRIYAKGWQ